MGDTEAEGAGGASGSRVGSVAAGVAAGLAGPSLDDDAGAATAMRGRGSEPVALGDGSGIGGELVAIPPAPGLADSLGALADGDWAPGDAGGDALAPSEGPINDGLALVVGVGESDTAGIAIADDDREGDGDGESDGDGSTDREGDGEGDDAMRRGSVGQVPSGVTTLTDVVGAGDSESEGSLREGIAGESLTAHATPVLMSLTSRLHATPTAATHDQERRTLHGVRATVARFIVALRTRGENRHFWAPSIVRRP